MVGYKKVHSMANSMTVLDDALPVMVDMAVRGCTGTVNMTNPGVIDHQTILELYRQKVDPKHTYTLVSKDTLQEQCVVAGRSNNFLQTLRVKEEYPEMPDIETSVAHVLDKCVMNEEAFVPV
jgi:UDP-glucose 4,6-dehydratase